MFTRREEHQGTRRSRTKHTASDPGPRPHPWTGPDAVNADPPKLHRVSAESDPATRVWRHLATWVLALIAIDLVLVVITGGASFLTPGLKVSPGAFALREAALGFALILRLRVLADAERRLSTGRLAIALAVLPALFHLQVVGRRITGDALYYYVFTRSMVRDADVDFANEYEHYGLLTRNDHSVPTVTGHRRTIYSVGPGLLWTPFFLAVDVTAAGFGALGIGTDVSGYGPLHLNAVALGSFGYGVAALFLIHALLRRHFGDPVSVGAVLLLFWASFYPWYLAEQPLTSHTASVFLVALFFVLRQNDAFESRQGALGLGLCIGLGMSVRWQNGVFLLLPAVDGLMAWRRGNHPRGLIARGALFASGVFAGALPQMLAWKAIYGEYLLPYPPQGTDFVRLGRPFLANLLFSSRHGLLSWTPVFGLCLLGLLLLTTRQPRRFGLFWAPVIIMTYVNACVGDWWAGGSFSNRRFDSLLPIFAFGLAAFLGAAIEVVRRRPSIVVAVLAMADALSNIWFARAVQGNTVLGAQPLPLAVRALTSAQALSDDLGFPTTWPASWIFAIRYQVSPAAFDLAAGKYLFYRQNNLDGVVDLGAPGDEAMILDGFTAPRRGAITHRSFASSARLIVSLDLPETLGILIRARTRAATAARLEVEVNGVPAEALDIQTEWSEGHLEAPQGLWRRGANIITLRPSSEVDLDGITFVRQVR